MRDRSPKQGQGYAVFATVPGPGPRLYQMDATSPRTLPTPAFPCPCCGYVSFIGPPGSYEICKICYWEDDIAQLRFPEMAGGPNRVSLVEAQENFRSFKAAEERLRPYVRRPIPEDRREPFW